MTRRFSLGRLLVFAIFLLLIVLGYYFGVLHTPEAGGAEIASSIGAYEVEMGWPESIALVVIGAYLFLVLPARRMFKK